MGLATQNHPGLSPVLTGLSGAGSSQATALALVEGGAHEFTSVPSSSGAILPVPKQFPCVVIVSNADTNTLSIYPPLGGTVAGGAANSAYSLAEGATATFWASSPTNYYLSAQSGAGEGTVTSVSVPTANGISGSVATATTTPAITLSAAGIAAAFSGKNTAF